MTESADFNWLKLEISSSDYELYMKTYDIIMSEKISINSKLFKVAYAVHWWVVNQYPEVFGRNKPEKRDDG